MPGGLDRNAFCPLCMLPSRDWGHERAPTAWAVFLLSLLAMTSGCITRRVNIALVPPAPESYSASIRFSATIGKHGVSASGGCAVDPSRGARIELRDPSGSANLLLLLTRDRGQLIALRSGLACEWGSSSPSIPFSSADLWFLFTGVPPSGLRDLQATEKGLSYATWNTPLGLVSCQLRPTSGELLSHDSGLLRGPGGTRLEVTWRGIQPGAFADAAFQPPEGLALIPAPFEEVLGEVAP